MLHNNWCHSTKRTLFKSQRSIIWCIKNEAILYASLKCWDYSRDCWLFWILLFSTGFSLFLQFFYFFGRFTFSNLYKAIFHVVDLCHKITIKLGSPPVFQVIQSIGWTPHTRSVWIYMREGRYIYTPFWPCSMGS